MAELTETASKKASKFDSRLATMAMYWVKSVCEYGDHANAVANIATPVKETDVQSALQSGIILCFLINVIKPGSVKMINTGTTGTALTPPKKMENINNFLSACENIGMDKVDLFKTADLYDANDIPQVIFGICALALKADHIGLIGWPLVAKESTENRRVFTKGVIKARKNGLEMGSKIVKEKPNLALPLKNK